jgi:PAS domain S-box-containing protein
VALASVTHLNANGGMTAPERLVLDAVGHAIIVTDLNGEITFWNSAAERLYGWGASEALGKNILDVTPTSQSRDQAKAIFDRLVTGESWSGEFDVRDRSGRWFPVHVIDTPVRDTSGAVIAIVGASIPLPGHTRIENRDTFAARVRRQLSDLLTPSANAGMVRSALFALTFLAIAIVLRLVLDTFVPGRVPYITFFPSVMLTAFYCNVPVTVAALVISAGIGTLWLEVPLGDSSPPFRLLGFVLFMLFGGANAGVVIYLKDVLTRLRERDRQLALINQELKHRMRNLFAVTSSICSRTAKYSTSIAETVSGIQGRIAAVASAQDLLGVGGEKASDLRALVDAVVRPLAPSPSRLTIEGPDTHVSVSDTLQFALVLHELSTNALKYGAWHGDTGIVAIEWRHSGPELAFTWLENVRLTAPPPARTGFGSDLIKRAFIGGSVEYNLGVDGLKCRIKIPLPAAPQAAA